MRDKLSIAMSLCLVLLGASLAACAPDQSPRLSGDGVLKPYRPNGVTLGDVVSLPVRPHAPEVFDVFVVNSSDHPLTITSANIIAVPGHPAPTLMHVGLERGKNLVGVQDQWPPSGVPVKDLIDSSLPPGRSAIAVAVTGRDVGITYATAGVVLSYRDGKDSANGPAWGGAVTCVVDNDHAARRCGDNSSGARDEVVRFIHKH